METETTGQSWVISKDDILPNRIYNSPLYQKLAPTLQQLLQYLVVGGIAFAFDFGALYLALQLNLHYLIATFIGFCVGLLCNFTLCITWVWRDTKARTLKDFSTFTLIGIAGLVLTGALMWLFVDVLLFAPTWSKAITAGVVLIWNFTLRKLFVFFH